VRKVAPGTQDASQRPGHDAAQCAQALANGIELVRDLPGNALLLGEMGIGNTSAASLMLARLCGLAWPNAPARAPGWTPPASRASAPCCAGAGRQRRRHRAAGRPGRAGRLRDRHHGGRRAAGRARAPRDPGGRLHHQRRRAGGQPLQPHVLQRCVFAHRSGERGHG
jgi:nicotinate-nucleotide--dimethylbenzimidazole phosphoribosyltransferase